MAPSDEHRMVFDIRGRRRHVVKFVYAILAILMAASLFLVVGPVNLGSLFGGSEGASNPALPFEEQAEGIERRIVKEPENANLYASLAQARILAGNQSVQETETQLVQTVESRAQYEKASEAWSKYLKATNEPRPNTAAQMATTLFTLATVSRSIPEAQANIKAATEAQEIYAEQQPTLNSLTNLSYYQLFNGEQKQAHATSAEAEPKAGNKFEREQVGNLFEEKEKLANLFASEVKKTEKEAKEGKKNGANPEAFESSLGGSALTE
jgi:hypothetical protein